MRRIIQMLMMKTNPTPTFKTYPKGQLPKELDDYEWIQIVSGNILGPNDKIGELAASQPQDAYLANFIIDCD